MTSTPEEEEAEKQQRRKRELEESVQAHPHDPSLRFQLGLLLWEIAAEDSLDRAAEHFVIAAKLNPQDPLPFKYLGHYYARVSFELQRSLKCYQRALTLNPDDSDSGEALCDLLHNLGKHTLELAICKDASDKSPRAFWAFRRLGYLHLHNCRCSEAVQNLQHAIRGYPTSADLWEALGLAYQRLGMFTAATKSYGRAIELEDTKIFSLVESGNVFLILGSFRKGVEQFQQALKISPQNVPANYGLASGLLGLSKECMNLGAFRWGASLLEDACKVGYTITCLAGNFSSIWKLHGDIQLTYAKCFPWMDEDQSLAFDAGRFNVSIISWKQTCHLAAMSAMRSYQRALHLAPWQANLYIDVAVASDFNFSMDHDYENDLMPWQLSEKMALGALLLEGVNQEFWVTLGCVSSHNVLKQHALIRGLQLDASLAVAWGSLGKLYREEGEKKLARQAFDCARSIDPSLALPWAGMSADINAREPTPDEAFESCLRAVQIFPLAEFQIGLAKLALLSGKLTASQVFVAIQQAVQHSPYYPESHNLNGLICEARSEYLSAIASYRLARSSLITSSGNSPKSHSRDVAINLARCLIKAGYAADAVQECENLKKQGILDEGGLQIYALSLWKLGKNDLALSVARDLLAGLCTMEKAPAATSMSFICRLLYYICGIDSVISQISKVPKQLLQSSKVSIIVSAILALDENDGPDSASLSIHHILSSDNENIHMHYLMALAKLVKHGSKACLGFQSGIRHLKKVLHMHPESSLIRNLLGHLLLSSEDGIGVHTASRCCTIDGTCHLSEDSLNSGCEILGTGAIACHEIGKKYPTFSFPTCGYQGLNGPGAVQELQRYLHRQPWNHDARYLLILNLFQKAREERFPPQVCAILERLIVVSLSNDLYSTKNISHQYQKFQTLLCASEIGLQSGNELGSIKHAYDALSLSLSNNYLFFGHLLLCRVYAAQNDYARLREEFLNCLDLRTDHHIGWMCLKMLESQYNMRCDLNMSKFIFNESSKEWTNSWNMWMGIFNLVLGVVSLWNKELLSAEESFAHACALAGAESCIFLCHGATCLELARQFCSSQFLELAKNSLTMARTNSISPLPIVSLLLAQAEGSLGSKEKWENNLRQEWYSWSQDARPAELFFQMHLLSKESKAVRDPSANVEFCQTPTKWVLRAIHTNPSCFRYWKVLQKLTE